jgi:hypothetical protein
MAFATKEAASISDFFYGKPGILAILLIYPFRVQYNFINHQNLTALIPSLKRKQCCQRY